MIPLIKPDINFDAVAGDLRAILESGQLTSGRFVTGFEAAVAKYVGSAQGFATTSATTAMHMVLVAMYVGPGDEVLVSDFTFPATGNVVVQVGAVPVLVDCLPGRFDMDPDDLAAKVTDRSRAIIVVHPFGQPADMTRINAIAKRHGLKVIEDAACALGATFADGTYCGAVSDAGCFSFHPRKLLTTGEGGMIVTRDEALGQRIGMLRSHGGIRGRIGLNFIENGFNYRMSEIQACLGLEQIGRFEAILEDRRRVARLYLDRVHAINDITVPLAAPVDQCTFQSFVVLLREGVDRGAVSERMRELGVETTLGTYAMHRHKAFARFGYTPGMLPNSDMAERQSLTIPLIAGMTEADVDQVLAVLHRAIKEV